MFDKVGKWLAEHTSDKALDLISLGLVTLGPAAFGFVTYQLGIATGEYKATQRCCNAIEYAINTTEQSIELVKETIE